MAIGVVMDFPGATLAQYDEVIARMGLTPGGDTAPGALFHWVAATPDGITVTDVWQTRELFDAFANEQIGPITMEVGFPGPPAMTFFDVHSHLIAKS
jgi:hypothetical protein